MKEPTHIPAVWKDLLSYVHLPLFSPAFLPHSRLFASGRVSPVTYERVYPLAKVTDGLAALEKRQTWAKAVVRIREEKPLTKAKL